MKRSLVLAALLAAATMAPAAAQDSDALSWARANSCVSIRDYVARFPTGRYVGVAREQLRIRNCPDPVADAQRRAQKEAADRARLENENRDIRDRLTREEAARRAAETRASDEARRRQTAESAARQTPPVVARYDLNQLHPDVRRAVESARAAASRADATAAQARQTAQAAEASGSAAPQSGLGIYASRLGTYAGDRYAGQFVGGKYEGYGVYSWAQNTNNTAGMLRYEGAFANNAPNGSGRVYWLAGNSYSGGITNWKKTGFGVSYNANGTRYEGALANDQANGFGILWSAEGTIVGSGVYRNDVLATPLSK